MDLVGFLISWLVSLFCSRPVCRPVALEHSILDKLPTEPILSIAEFLPPEAVLSFAICCRPIHFAVGKYYLEALQKSRMDWVHRYKFILLLERDLPNYIPCYYCVKLHSTKKAQGYKVRWDAIKRKHCFSERSYPPCSVKERKSKIWSYIHPEFCFVIFQMVMKHHRQGSVPSSLLALLSYPITTWFAPNSVKQTSISVRIVADSMLVRQQQIFLVPPMQHADIVPRRAAPICPHFEFFKKPHQLTFWDAFRVRYCGSLSGCRLGGEGLSCAYCLTEFRIDFKWTEDRTMIMFITKWMDLGQGRSPLEQKWRGRSYDDFFRDEWTLRTIGFEPGSICSRFEQKEYSRFEFDSLLTRQDKKELLSRSPYSWREFHTVEGIVFKG